MIPGTCPDCGAIRPLADYLRDAQARAALAAALECPAPLARRIVPYLALFAPPTRAIQLPKLARLLTELAALLTGGTVSRRGLERPATPELWAAALDQVAAARESGTLTLPLDGHGYLTEIAWRLAEQAGRGQPAAAPAHPSQAPAPASAVAPAADWGTRRGSGLTQVGALTQLLKGL